jgi:outer membrane protein
MKAFSRTILFIVVLLFVGAVTADAQVKLGFVDSEAIVTGLDEFKVVETKIRTLQTSYQDTLRAYEANFKAKLESYQKQQALMTAEARTKEEEQLKGMEQLYYQYQQERFGQQGTLAQVQAQLLQPLKDKVRTAIEKVAKDEKIAAVMEKGLLIYSDSKMDITFKVLDYLKRGN